MKNVGEALACIGDAELAIDMFAELDEGDAGNAAIDAF